jgi:hypothetical protein
LSHCGLEPLRKEAISKGLGGSWDPVVGDWVGVGTPPLWWPAVRLWFQF